MEVPETPGEASLKMPCASRRAVRKVSNLEMSWVRSSVRTMARTASAPGMEVVVRSKMNCVVSHSEEVLRCSVVITTHVVLGVPIQHLVAELGNVHGPANVVAVFCHASPLGLDLEVIDGEKSTSCKL